jgi:hypothetical protein
MWKNKEDTKVLTGTVSIQYIVEAPFGSDYSLESSWV